MGFLSSEWSAAWPDRRGLAVVLIGLLAAPLLATAQDEIDGGWPRELTAEKATIVVYQPQIESLDGNKLSGRAAVSVEQEGKDEPVFGAIWLVATVQVDREERMVYVEDLRVPRVRFAESTPEQEAALSALVERELPKGDLSMSLDRVIAALEAVERETAAAADLSTKPPDIVIRNTPTVLIPIEGEPELGAIPDTKLMRVMNTAALIAFDSSAKTYYLYAAKDSWYTARKISGDWTFTEQVPAQIAKLAPEEVEEAEDEDDPEAAPKTAGPPKILISTKPTELINIDGDPLYTPVADEELMYVSNADGDIIRDVSSQDYYVLLSGRWYRSKSLDGPWQYVAADALPEAFAEIPADSEVADVRAFVAGTDEAQDAVLDAQIPETAAVSRSEATIEVQYDGKPKLKPIEGTSLAYVENASESVLKAGATYYACSEGVWYVADAANGPWRVATERPPGVDAIPPSSPVYNVKYVYIYDVTPEVVYVGYTAGYAGGYVYGPTIVYGTGYWYRPWWGRVFYPRPVTWGFRVRWSPWGGWAFGFGYRGLTFGVGVGFWSPWRAAWWGPVGFHGYRVGYRRGYYRGYNHGYYHGARAGAHAGYRAGARAGYRHSAYVNSRPGVKPANRPYTADRARTMAATQNRAAARDRVDAKNRAATQDRAGTRDAAANRAARDRPDAGNRAAQTGAAQRDASQKKARKNDVYADRDGNVRRRTSDGAWEDVTRGRSGASNAKSRDTSASNARNRNTSASNAKSRDRSTSTRPSTSPSRNQSSQLERDARSRSRGSARTKSYQQHRSSGASRGGGGRRGGGGGGGRR